MRRGASRCSALALDEDTLDAVVVASPVDDALLDGLGLEVLGEGLADKSGQFVVGGEAEGDELFDRELMDVGAIFGWKECLEAEALLEANNAVLNDEGAVPGAAGHDEEDDGHGDPPEMESPVIRPVVDGDVDGEDEVQQKHGQDKEVKGRIEAHVVLEVLRSRHWNPLEAGYVDGPQHITLWDRLKGWRIA